MTPLCGSLTDREEAVLLAWADDLSLPDVAQRLGITERQVRRATETAMRTLGVGSRTAAVAIVVRLRQGATVA